MNPPLPDPGSSPFRRLAAGLRHAFSMGPPGPAQPSPAERATLDRILREVVRRGMTGPAILFLDSAHPLNGVSAAAIHFLAPFAGVVVDDQALRSLASFLDKRGSFRWIIHRLEELEGEATAGSRRLGSPERGDPGSQGGPGALESPDRTDRPGPADDR